MDAVRLVRATGRALREAGGVEDLIAEAWQAQTLAEAVSGHVALHGTPEIRAAGLSVCRTDGSICGAPGPPGVSAAVVVRAAMLTGAREPAVALRELRDLLTEAGEALVSAACSTEDETLYWRCIDAVDAADDSKDRVVGLLGALASFEDTS